MCSFYLICFDVPFWPAFLLPDGSVVNCLFGRYLSVNSLAFLTGAVNEILIYCELLIYSFLVTLFLLTIKVNLLKKN